jgi:hypothetical protein
VLDGEREDEASEDERDDVVHVGLRDGVGGGDAERREEEERRHGRDAERHGIRDPPQEHPRQHPEHVARRGVPAEVSSQHAEQRARQRARRDGQVLVGENGPERGARASRTRRPPVIVVHGQQWPRHVLRRALPAGASRIHGGRKFVGNQPCLRFAAGAVRSLAFLKSEVGCFYRRGKPGEHTNTTVTKTKSTTAVSSSRPYTRRHNDHIYNKKFLKKLTGRSKCPSGTFQP